MSLRVIYLLGFFFTSLILACTLFSPVVFSHYSWFENNGLTEILHFFNTIEMIYGFTCHQNPERCFWICEVSMPLCVRCFGMVLGTFTASVVSMIFLPSGTLYDKIRTFLFLKKDSSIWTAISVSLVLMFPMIIDGFSQFIFEYDSPDVMRFVTGLLFGYLRGVMFLSLLATVFERTQDGNKLKDFYQVFCDGKG